MESSRIRVGKRRGEEMLGVSLHISTASLGVENRAAQSFIGRLLGKDSRGSKEKGGEPIGGTHLRRDPKD